MKKIIFALLMSFGLSAQAADPIVGVYVLGVLVGSQMDKEVPAHLSDECKPKWIKYDAGNYEYISYEHCLKK